MPDCLAPRLKTAGSGGRLWHRRNIKGFQELKETQVDQNVSAELCRAKHRTMNAVVVCMPQETRQRRTGATPSCMEPSSAGEVLAQGQMLQIAGIADRALHRHGSRHGTERQMRKQKGLMHIGLGRARVGLQHAQCDRPTGTLTSICPRLHLTDKVR